MNETTCSSRKYRLKTHSNRHHMYLDYDFLKMEQNLEKFFQLKEFKQKPVDKAAKEKKRLGKSRENTWEKIDTIWFRSKCMDCHFQKFVTVRNTEQRNTSDHIKQAYLLLEKAKYYGNY